MKTWYEIEDVAYVELEKQLQDHIYNVMGIVVDAEYRNMGIGTALMRVVGHDADKQGIEIWLHPTAEEGRAEDLLRFYTRLGYKDHGGYLRRLPWTGKQPT